MEDGFKKLVFGFILFTLFSYLVLSFITDGLQQNDKEVAELEEGVFDLSNYNESLDQVRSDAETFRERFEKGSVWSNIAGVVVTGIFGIAIDMIQLILSPFSLLSNLLTYVGVPDIVVSILLGLVILSIIFGIWALIKIGQ